MDFGKVFDAVTHRRNIAKLKTTILRIECLLSDRQQIVTANRQNSGWQEVTSGIPQGSVLGTVSFVVFKNDLSSVKSSEGFKFADDTKLYKAIMTPDHQADMQENLYNWEDRSDKWLSVSIWTNVSRCTLYQKKIQLRAPRED